MNAKYLLRTGLVALIAASAASSVIAQDKETPLRLSNDTLQCVIDNADNYLALDKDPVLIFFDLCPKAEPSAEEFISLATNSLPTVKLSDSDDNADITRVAALRKSEIECIVRMNETEESGSPEADKPEIIEISLADCTAKPLAKAP